MFPAPGRLDLDRPNIGQHMAVGHGLHFCLDAPLTRLEVYAAVNAVLDRDSVMAPSDEVWLPARLAR